MRRTKLALVVITLLCGSIFGLSGSVWAQTPVPSPTPATTRIAFDHDGVNTDGYKIKIDTAEPVALVAECAGTGEARTCTAPFPALTPGQHSLVIIAFNAAAEAASDPFLVTVFVQPAKPLNIRIIKIEDGE